MRRPILHAFGGVAALALVAAMFGPATTAAAGPTQSGPTQSGPTQSGPTQSGPTQSRPTGGRYIVKTSSASAATSRSKRLASADASIGHQYRHVFDGFSASLTSGQLNQLRTDPTVESVVPVTEVHASDVSATAATKESDATWGLDRIDQRTGTDGSYFYNSTGVGVTAYVIDTGIRMDQTEFEGRATSGWDFVDNDANASDCASNYVDSPSTDRFSHGTHVAGTIGGTTYGVAKEVSIVSLRVLDCDGWGTSDDVIKAMDWVIAHHPNTPSVINFSLGGSRDSALDAAVNAVIQAGIPVVTAAGNDNQDACTASPADVPAALTVAATDSDDDRASFSNYGSCVDLFAPGVAITSAGTKTTSSSLVLSGTSMAAPHVTGAVARYLETHPSASPAQVTTAIDNDASVVGVGGRKGSPDRLLYVYSQKTPSKPTGVALSRSDKNKTVTISWKAPASDGDEPITGYRVTRTGTDAAGSTSASAILGAGARSATFSGLAAGKTYALTVQARNDIGYGPTASGTISLTALPGKPKITSASSGSKKDGKVSVSLTWSKPSSGGPVKSYLITATRNSTGAVTTKTVSASARTATVSGLKKGKAYTLRIRAANASGSGPTATWKKSVTAR